jgi:hypothetical protein
VKRDRALLFQSLLSLALVAFAGLFVVSLLTSVRLSPSKGPPEASRDLAVADRAGWNQFYDAVVGSDRAPEVAPPADAMPEKRAAADVVEVPTVTRVPEDQAPSASVPSTATTTLPVAPHSTSSELTAKTDAPPAPAAAPPDPARETGVGVAVSNEPSRDQVPHETAPSVAAAENASPALATASVPPLDGNAEKSTPSTTPPAARPVPMPRPKVAAPAPPVPSAARVKQAAPQPERETERGRPSTPPARASHSPGSGLRRSPTDCSGTARSGSIRSTSARRRSNPVHCLMRLRQPTRCHPADRNSARTSLTDRARRPRADPACNSLGRRRHASPPSPTTIRSAGAKVPFTAGLSSL